MLRRPPLIVASLFSREFRLKLRRLPEDFRVEELTSATADGGPFALYRLSKRSLTTMEAIDRLAVTLRVPKSRVAYGGLKDKHAVTSQYVTVERGPRGNHGTDWWSLEYLGQRSRPFHAHDIAANRFELVLRDMAESEISAAKVALGEVERSGLPNYFDDQRFGSLGQTGEFIGAAWCRGDYERAVWLALADPVADDRADEREQKRLLRDLWGQWAEAKEKLARSPRRSIVTFLVDHPTDFKRALALIRVDLRGLYLSAFQSAIWNRTAAKLIDAEAKSAGTTCTPVVSDWGTALFPATLPSEVADRLAQTVLPLPSARNHQELGTATAVFAEEAQSFGLELRELRVKYPRDSFFSKGDRMLCLRPSEVNYQEDADDLYAGRCKLTLKFVLPRGAYATILVKRLTACAGQGALQIEPEIDPPAD